MSAIRSLLESIFAPFNALMSSLPIEVARPSALILLALPVLWVWLRFNHDQLTKDALDRSRWRDLRIWALLFTLPYFILYGWFG